MPKGKKRKEKASGEGNPSQELGQQKSQGGPERPPSGQAKNPPPRASPVPSKASTEAASEVSAAPAKPAWGPKPQSSDPKPASGSQQKRGGRDQREAVSSRPDPAPAKPAWVTKPQSSDPKPASESQQKRGGGEQREAVSSRPDPAPAKPAWGPKPQSSDPKPASESQQKRGGRDQREAASSKPDPVQQAPKQTPRRDDGGGKRPDERSAREVVSTPGGRGDIEKETEKVQIKETENMLIISPRRKINQNEKPGRRLMVQTNHLAISLPKKKIIAYHYDVTFDPDKPRFLIRPAWNEFAARFFPRRSPSFDGKKNVYSNGPLPQVGEGSMTEEVTIRNHENDRDKTFKITIKIANKVDLSRVLNYVGASDERGVLDPRDAMQAIDIILRNLPANQMVQSGRLFFSPPRGRIFSLGEGLDLWYGFHQSAILGWKPYLNVDIAHKGFPKPCNLLETLRDVCGWDGRSELDRDQSQAFRKYIKKLKVEYKIPHLPSSKRVYKVNDIGEKASTLRFTLDNGTTTTVARYFESDKNYRLQYPFLPCLWVGSLAKKIYIPLELCTVVQGQVLNGKMSENQTSAMVREAAKGTPIRKQKIMEQIAQAQFNRSPYANEFEISVAGEFEKVEARVLDPPKLQYQDRTVNPSRGVWRGTVFNNPAQLTGWCILCLDSRTRPDTLSDLERKLFRAAQDLNMNPENASRPSLKIDARNLKNIFDDLKTKDIRIVFVVVPDFGDAYSRVKKISELEVGILTQCLKASTVFRKLNDATIGNILLKVNAKLNGKNLTLDKNTRPACFMRPVMIVGADVTHPSPDSKDIPSVAAVAASHDPDGFQYNMVLRLQDPRDEMIRDLQNIMREQLLFFYRKTQLKPEKIIFYRDGVSDGQIIHVFNIEFQAIRRACASISPDYQPKITFVIVQKRHHTRFFPNPEDKNIDDKRNYNVPAGTCVDTDIVHPRETDFYLVSHAAIQGTSRPTKYRLVWDDSDMGEIELQKLTYHLCHLFSRCTRSVSYPAPTYNAHLAAFRGRVYLEGESVNLTMLENEQRRRKIHDDIRSSAPMHFV